MILGHVSFKKEMWVVLLDDMGLDSSVELALSNLDLNEPVIKPITFDDGNPPEGWSSIPADARIGLDIEEEDRGESNGSDTDFDDFDMEEDY